MKTLLLFGSLAWPELLLLSIITVIVIVIVKVVRNSRGCINEGKSSDAKEIKYCPNCGKPNDTKAKFCKDCGSKLE